MGIIYFLLEIAYDGDSHWSMIILGSCMGFLIGLINKKLSWDTPLWKQVLIGELIVLPSEFIVGVIVNLCLKWNVWDYSGLWLAEYFLNQSSPLFAVIFIPVILLAILFDDYYRWIFMGEEKPKYKLK